MATGTAKAQALGAEGLASKDGPEALLQKAGAKSNSSTTSAVQGASVLIILQIASRAVTFVANQLLLRFLTARLLGVATQLEVYYLSVLFFARESLRVAIQRQGGRDGEAKGGSSRDSQSVVNVAYLGVSLGLLVSVGLGGLYVHYVDASTASTPYLRPALYLYGIAAIVELLSEPAFVVLQHRLRFGPRAAAESIATFLRCVFTFGTAGLAWKRGLEVGVLPFAIGQLAYGIGLLLVYLYFGWALARSEGFSLLPKRLTSSKGKDPENVAEQYTAGYFYRPTIQLASSLVAQSVVKHILTQGDTFLVSILSTPQAQGVYALANNYGSLLARLVFQPIEESSRNYFSKVLSTPTTNTAQLKDSKEEDAPKDALERARSSLLGLLHFYTLLSTLILTLGPFALPLLIQLLLGARSSSSFEGAGPVLARYCLYIPLLALNGVSEAFVSSVATERQVHAQSLWMGGFTLAFGAAGYLFLSVLGMGARGLVYANGINMLCRIAWSASFISAWFRGKGVGFGWAQALPGGLGIQVVGTGVLWQGLTMAGISPGAVSPHVVKDLVTVAVFAMPYVAVVAYMERKYLMECYRTLRAGRVKP